MKYNDAVVTGYTGFIGTHLTEKLKLYTSDVYGVSRTSNNINITKWEQVQSIPARSIVFHLAGAVSISDSFKNPLTTYESNIIGTLNMLEWCRTKDVKRMIYSSTFIYGNPTYLPVDETHKAAPSSPYACSKHIGEQLCKAYSKDYGIDITILRLFNIYGPGQKGSFLIPTIFEQLSNATISLADPSPKRDYVYIDDAVDAFLHAAAFDGKGCNIFNIGSGKSYSVDEVVNFITNEYFYLTGKRTNIHYRNEIRVNEIAETVANIEKAKNILGWHPKTDMSTGIKNTLREFLHESKR